MEKMTLDHEVVLEGEKDLITSSKHEVVLEGENDS
jgi:hypothetical protein